MSENDSTPAVACTLTEEQARERPDWVRTTLVERYKHAEERSDGYTLVFDGAGEALRAVSAFVANERQCCSFADYSVSVSPPYDETRFTVTGPEGTKDLFGEGLVEALEAAT